jgi:hypothetical protein
MIPIVFCASFVPWVKATKPPDTSCRRRKTRFTTPGWRLRMAQRSRSMIAAARMIPKNGARSDGIEHLVDEPVPVDRRRDRRPRSADPITPPMSAWLELEGRPIYHVIRFHVIAPTRPARTMSSVIASESTRPLAIVAATLKETNAPAKLRTADMRTASRGESARVETLVAIEFAVSWKPFVKSKKSATTTTATSVRSSMER